MALTLPNNIFGAAELTDAVNQVPRSYTLLGELGIFDRTYLRSKNVVIDERQGNLNLIPAAERGGPAAQNKTGSRAARSLTTPWFPLADAILAADFDGQRGFGSEDFADVQDEISDRLIELSRKHQNMQEYLRWTALNGVVKDGAGNTMLDIFTEYSIVRQSFDFDFGTTKIRNSVNNVRRYFEANAGGATITGVLVLASNGFWDQMMAQSEIETAYANATSGINPLRENLSGVFDFAGARFVNVNHSFSYEAPDGTTSTYNAVPSNEAIVIPMSPSGQSVFRHYFSPGPFVSTVGRKAQEIYVSAEPMAHDQGVSLLSGSASLPLCTRPKLLAKATVT